ncbi:MAG: xanthine dehydrogenase accessory factor [Paracoccaceae bacterium]|jgi:xanthine dehydrogenase accessory factor
MVSGCDLAALDAAVARHGRVMRVVVAQTRGSVPREAGAAMLVWDGGFDGTIGGGALEWEALAEARRRLNGGTDGVRAWPLGPGLGQCCGGAVTLAFEGFDAGRLAAIDRDVAIYARPLGPPASPPPSIRAHARAARAGEAPGIAVSLSGTPWLSELLRPATTPLFLYGAGHVGRAVTRVFLGLPFAITWIDDAPARFPADPMATPLVARNPADAAALAPIDAVHIVMTYSHALDLEICHRVLARGGFARLGVIGSASKSARFRSRLRALGHGDAAIARLECPIGAPGLGGKAPAEIAVSLAADLLGWRGALLRTSSKEAAS